MIDLHCHILPGVDDGPASLEQSLAMAEIAEADGITTIVATPHVQGIAPTSSQIGEACLELNQALKARGAKLEILAGAEVYALANPAGLEDRTINSTRYILVEFPLSHLPVEAGKILFNLVVHGFRPIIAHPERIPTIIGNPKLITSLLNGQVMLQLTGASLTGRFGEGPKKCGAYLLKQGLVHFLASDGHSANFRRPLLMEGVQAAAHLIGREGAERLVYANPQAVLAGQDITDG